MSICSCDSGLGNTGLPSCYKPLTVPVAMYLLQTYDSTGVKNSIDGSVPVDEAFVTAKVNQADVSKRWYPLQEITAVVSERGEATYDEATNGQKSFVKQGVRTFTCEIRSGGAKLASNIEQGKCKEVSLFLVDSEGKLIGMDLDETGTFLHPVRVQKGTMNVPYVFATDSTVEKITVSFDWNTNEKDSNLSYIEPSTDMTGFNGLLDIFSKKVGVSTSSTFSIKLTNEYGGVGGKGILTGLLAGDFALYNVTDSLAVVITSVTETAGTYDFIIPAQAVNEKIRVTISPLKTGYDFSAVVANLITL